MDRFLGLLLAAASLGVVWYYSDVLAKSSRRMEEMQRRQSVIMDAEIAREDARKLRELLARLQTTRGILARAYQSPHGVPWHDVADDLMPRLESVRGVLPADIATQLSDLHSGIEGLGFNAPSLSAVQISTEAKAHMTTLDGLLPKVQAEARDKEERHRDLVRKTRS